jgi:hypothetical protein
VPASLEEKHLGTGIGCAQRRCDRGRPENMPERLRESKERHCPAVAILRDRASLADIHEGARRASNLHARRKSGSVANVMAKRGEPAASQI